MEFPVDLLDRVDPEYLEQSAKEYMSQLLCRNPETHDYFTIPDSKQIELVLRNMSFVPLYGVDVKKKVLALFLPEEDFKVVGLYLLGQWWSVEDILKTTERSRTGLHEVLTTGERIVLYVLNRIFYRTKEMTSEDVPFLCHGENEIAKILWKDGEAIGFYSVKAEGSLCSSFLTQCYQLPVMDTIFVRKSHRGNGYGLYMLEDFVGSFRNDFLGLKYPLTTAMYKVCKQYLSKYPEDQELLWEVKSIGGPFQRKQIAKRLQAIELKGNHRVVGRLNFESDSADAPVEDVITQVQRRTEYTEKVVEEVVQIKLTKEVEDMPVTASHRSNNKPKSREDIGETTEKINRVEGIDIGVQSLVDDPVFEDDTNSLNVKEDTAVTLTHNVVDILDVTHLHCEEQKELSHQPKECVQDVLIQPIKAMMTSEALLMKTKPTAVTERQSVKGSEDTRTVTALETDTGPVVLPPLEVQKVVEASIIKTTLGTVEIKENTQEVTRDEDGKHEAEQEMSEENILAEDAKTSRDIAALQKSWQQTQLDHKPVPVASEDVSAEEKISQPGTGKRKDAEIENREDTAVFPAETDEMHLARELQKVEENVLPILKLQKHDVVVADLKDVSPTPADKSEACEKILQSQKDDKTVDMTVVMDEDVDVEPVKKGKDNAVDQISRVENKGAQKIEKRNDEKIDSGEETASDNQGRVLEFSVADSKINYVFPLRPSGKFKDQPPENTLTKRVLRSSAKCAKDPSKQGYGQQNNEEDNDNLTGSIKDRVEDERKVEMEYLYPAVHVVAGIEPVKETSTFQEIPLDEEKQTEGAHEPSQVDYEESDTRTKLVQKENSDNAHKGELKRKKANDPYFGISIRCSKRFKEQAELTDTDTHDLDELSEEKKKMDGCPQDENKVEEDVRTEQFIEQDTTTDPDPGGAVAASISAEKRPDLHDADTVKGAKTEAEEKAAVQTVDDSAGHEEEHREPAIVRAPEIMGGQSFTESTSIMKPQQTSIVLVDLNKVSVIPTSGIEIVKTVQCQEGERANKTNTAVEEDKFEETKIEESITESLELNVEMAAGNTPRRYNEQEENILVKEKLKDDKPSEPVEEKSTAIEAKKIAEKDNNESCKKQSDDQESMMLAQGEVVQKRSDKKPLIITTKSLRRRTVTVKSTPERRNKRLTKPGEHFQKVEAEKQTDVNDSANKTALTNKCLEENSMAVEGGITEKNLEDTNEVSKVTLEKQCNLEEQELESSTAEEMTEIELKALHKIAEGGMQETEDKENERKASDQEVSVEAEATTKEMDKVLEMESAEMEYENIQNKDEEMISLAEDSIALEKEAATTSAAYVKATATTETVQKIRKSENTEDENDKRVNESGEDDTDLSSDQEEAVIITKHLRHRTIITTFPLQGKPVPLCMQVVHTEKAQAEKEAEINEASNVQEAEESQNQPEKESEDKFGDGEASSGEASSDVNRNKVISYEQEEKNINETDAAMAEVLTDREKQTGEGETEEKMKNNVTNKKSDMKLLRDGKHLTDDNVEKIESDRISKRKEKLGIGNPEEKKGPEENILDKAEEQMLEEMSEGKSKIEEEKQLEEKKDKKHISTAEEILHDVEEGIYHGRWTLRKRTIAIKASTERKSKRFCKQLLDENARQAEGAHTGDLLFVQKPETEQTNLKSTAEATAQGDDQEKIDESGIGGELSQTAQD